MGYFNSLTQVVRLCSEESELHKKVVSIVRSACKKNGFDWNAEGIRECVSEIWKGSVVIDVACNPKKANDFYEKYKADIDSFAKENEISWAERIGDWCWHKNDPTASGWENRREIVACIIKMLANYFDSMYVSNVRA